ncbi:MAG: hypothetical protein Kow006_16350 [Gammaproteobacteria bacterium]
MEADKATSTKVTLDMTGSVCPGPLSAAKKMVEELDNGAVLMLISDCPGTGDDLRAWARHTNNQLLGVEDLGDNRKGYLIQKGDPWPSHVVLDMRGTACPGPIIEARRLLEGMDDGEVLKLVSNCRGIPSDIESWTKNTSHELLGQVEDADGTYHFFIRK